MLRRYHSFFGRLYLLLDAFAVFCALPIAWWLRFHTSILPHFGGQYHFHQYMAVLIPALPAVLITSSMVGMYGTTRTSSIRVLARQLVKSVFVMAMFSTTILFVNKQGAYSRGVLILFVLFSYAFILTGRVVVRKALQMLRVRGLNRKYILIVGYTKATDTFLRHLEMHSELGYSVLGYLDREDPHRQYADVAAAAESPSTNVVKATVPYMGQWSQLDDILSEHIVDHIVLTLPNDSSTIMADIIRVAESHGVHTMLVPDFVDILPSKPRFDEFAGLPIVDTRYTPLDEILNVSLKRTFDICFSLLVLVVGSPILLGIAAVIKMTSPGPVIYAQERLGKNRRPFKMYKFRTMTHQTMQDDDEGWTVPNDPRRTRIGRILRRTSLDELPQFYNVLRGDMSVIGPRPERAHFAQQFRVDVPRYMIKHRVRPGITGWAQVNGLRGDTSIEDRIEFDLRYIEQWSFTWDLRIVLMTIWKGFTDRNAY